MQSGRGKKKECQQSDELSILCASTPESSDVGRALIGQVAGQTMRNAGAVSVQAQPGRERFRALKRAAQ